MVASPEFIVASDNARRILTLLYRAAPLSKAELSKRGHMAWATVVKIVDRLERTSIVRQVGVAQRSGERGKRAALFDLTDLYPIAVGIDVEYNLTTIAASNLRRSILVSEEHPTPSDPDRGALLSFLFELITDFLSEHIPHYREVVVGVGIGLPGIGVPSWSKSQQSPSNADLGEALTERIGIPVRIQSNTRCYTVYEKWTNQAFSSDDFMFVSIRTGVGSGIYLKGSLLNGHQGLAGELGHLSLDPNGPMCRCGRKGCVETLTNQRYIYRRYREAVLGHPDDSEEISSAELYAGISELFSKAKWGNGSARAVVEELAVSLSRGIAPAIMILNPPSVIVSGHFGPDGDVLIPFLSEQVRERVLSRVKCAFRYVEFDDSGHSLGAALLIFQDFLLELPGR